MRVKAKARDGAADFRSSLRRLEVSLLPDLLPTEAEANVRRNDLFQPDDFIGRCYRFSSGATITVSLDGVIRLCAFQAQRSDDLSFVLNGIKAAIAAKKHLATIQAVPANEARTIRLLGEDYVEP